MFALASRKGTSMTTMTAAVIHEPGGPEMLKLEQCARYRCHNEARC